MKNSLFLLSVLFFTSCTGKRTELIFNTDDVQGLVTEAKITLNGFEIGKVEDIKITPNGSVDIISTINPETKIPVDSKFKIENVDLSGSKGITVKLGERSEHLKNGDVVQLVKKESINKDSLTVKLGAFIENAFGAKKEDSLLIELRRLNENLEQRNN